MLSRVHQCHHLVFSLLPRCQGLCESQKNIGTPMSLVKRT
jgi:hypothetical protein